MTLDCNRCGRTTYWCNCRNTPPTTNERTAMSYNHDVYDIVICSDCLIWHCNADDTGFCWCEGPVCTNDEHEAIRTARAIERQPLVRQSSIVPTGDGEGSFSSHRCDACGSTLGGTRHDAQLIVGAR